MTNKLKIGIAGYGGFGQALCKTFQELEDVEVVGVFNRGEERRKIAEKQGIKTYSNYEQFLKLAGLDAVVIATANSVHAEQCIQAAEAGKHIFCEKPLTLDLQSFDQILTACDKAGVITHLDFSMRFGAQNINMLEIIRSGKIGKVLTLCVRRTRGFGLWAAGKRHTAIVDPKTSGGWNIHHNVHGTDLIIQMAGQKVVEVYAKHLKSASDTPCDEINVGMLTFANGAVGHIFDSTSIFRDEYICAIGDKGTITIRDHKLILKMEDGVETIIEEKSQEKNLCSPCRAFAQACLGKGHNNIPFHEGRHCLEVLLAMNRSSAEGEIIRLI